MYKFYIKTVIESSNIMYGVYNGTNVVLEAFEKIKDKFLNEQTSDIIEYFILSKDEKLKEFFYNILIEKGLNKDQLETIILFQ